MEDYAFNMSQLALSDCLVDRANRQQPTASDQVKDTMVQLFAGDDYASHMHMLREANPKAAQALVRFAQDVSAAHGPETLEQGLPAGLTQTEEKRVDTHELVLALLWRTHARRHSCGALHMRGPTLARAWTPLLVPPPRVPPTLSDPRPASALPPPLPLTPSPLPVNAWQRLGRAAARRRSASTWRQWSRHAELDSACGLCAAVQWRPLASLNHV